MLLIDGIKIRLGTTKTSETIICISYSVNQISVLRLILTGSTQIRP